MVTTVHDLAVFDTPWAFAFRRVVGERLIVARSIMAADAVIAVSAFTAERIKAIFKREAVVIPEAPSPSMRIPGPDEEVIAVRNAIDSQNDSSFTSALSSHERISRILLRHVNVSGFHSSWPVVQAGKPIRLRGDRVGIRPGSDLPALYGAATVAAYVSVYEGFGLPPLEAMACGCPVLSTRVPAVTLVGGGASIVNSPTTDNLTP